MPDEKCFFFLRKVKNQKKVINIEILVSRLQLKDSILNKQRELLKGENFDVQKQWVA